MGDGPERARLQTLMHELHLDDIVEFVPPAPPAKVAEVMRQLDALVLPSRTTAVWKEQFGRVLVEAMASRVAVVGANSGAIPEVIGDAGLLFHEGDAVMLADELGKLIVSPTLQEKLADCGYRRVLQNYTQERIAEQTVALYEQQVG
jgi:glycosyltransferase involved in cell wall biosynthesis